MDLRQLDGSFALVTYVKHTDHLIVASDPFGLWPLYIAERDGKSYVSTSALTLARHLGSGPNHLGLAVLLCCGNQYGSITNWEGIERLGAATAVTFKGGNGIRSTYWRPEPTKSYRG